MNLTSDQQDESLARFNLDLPPPSTASIDNSLQVARRHLEALKNADKSYARTKTIYWVIMILFWVIAEAVIRSQVGLVTSLVIAVIGYIVTGALLAEFWTDKKRKMNRKHNRLNALISGYGPATVEHMTQLSGLASSTGQRQSYIDSVAAQGRYLTEGEAILLIDAVKGDLLVSTKKQELSEAYHSLGVSASAIAGSLALDAPGSTHSNGVQST